MEIMKKYIISTGYMFYESDTLDDFTGDAIYYAKIKNIDNKTLGVLKRTSLGSKAEQKKLQTIFNMNEVIAYENSRIFQCQKCGKFIHEDEGITCTNGKWVCDDNNCRTLDEENEAYYKED
jgi:hypothetical protein